MEQAVWLYVGIIAALIGLVFVASIVISGRDTMNEQTVENNIRKIQQNCNLVCASDTETMFSVDTPLVAGMKLYSEGNAICTDYKGKTNCKKCDCVVFDTEGSAFVLDLSDATELFETSNYKCFMERTEEGVAIECKG